MYSRHRDRRYWPGTGIGTRDLVIRRIAAWKKDVEQGSSEALCVGCYSSHITVVLSKTAREYLVPERIARRASSLLYAERVARAAGVSVQRKLQSLCASASGSRQGMSPDVRCAAFIPFHALWDAGSAERTDTSVFGLRVHVHA